MKLVVTYFYVLQACTARKFLSSEGDMDDYGSSHCMMVSALTTTKK